MARPWHTHGNRAAGYAHEHRHELDPEGHWHDQYTPGLDPSGSGLTVMFDVFFERLPGEEVPGEIPQPVTLGDVWAMRGDQAAIEEMLGQ